MTENDFLTVARLWIVLDFLQTFALRILDFLNLYGKPFIDKRDWEATVVLLHRGRGAGGVYSLI